MAKPRKKTTKKKATKKRSSTAKRRSTTKKKATKKRVTKKKSTKKKSTKKKATKKRTSKKKSTRARKARRNPSTAMVKYDPKAMNVIMDKWTRDTTRRAALECDSVADCTGYIDQLLDAMDYAFAHWEEYKEDNRLKSKEIKQLEAKLHSTEGEIKGLKAELTKAKKAKKVKATSASSIERMLDAISKEIRALKTDVRKVARGRQLSLPTRGAAKAKKPRKSKPKRAARGRQMPLPPGGYAKYDAASGAGCSLAAVRWLYSGPEDCAPKGYKPSEAGRRLANLRWHDVPSKDNFGARRRRSTRNPGHEAPVLNPSDYYEMGYEDGARANPGGIEEMSIEDIRARMGEVYGKMDAAKAKARPKKRKSTKKNPGRSRSSSNTSSGGSSSAAARVKRALGRI